MQPVPGPGHGSAVAGRLGNRGDRGSGQVAGPASLSPGPCRDGRPFAPGARGGAGKYITRSERSRPSSSTGRSASRQARRVTSYPASKTIRMSGSPSFCWPASISRVTTSRTRAAVVAEQPIRAGGRAWPQPVAHIHRQHQAAVGGPRQRQPGHRPAQPADLDLTVVHRVIQRPVPAPVLWCQRQAHQGLHRPLRAQHRLPARTAHPPAP